MDAVGARLQLLLKQGERLAVALAGLVLAALLAALVLLGALAALTLALAPQLGAAAALGITTLIAAVIAALVAGVSYAKLRGPAAQASAERAESEHAESEEALQAELAIADARLRRALHGEQPDARGAHGPAAGHAAPGSTSAGGRNSLESLGNQAVELVKAHPVLVAGAGLAILSLVGPGRALRLASRGAATAAMVMSLSRNVGRVMEAARDSRDAARTVGADGRTRAATSPPASRDGDRAVEQSL